MAKKEKKGKKMDWSEWFIYWGAPLGAFSCLAACAPPIYWRLNRMDSQMTVMFPAERQYSLFALTDKTGGRVGWSTLYTNTCLKYQQFAAAAMSIQGMIGSVAAGFIGGGAVGCKNWQDCKNHVAMRCTEYRTFNCISMGSGAAIACAGMLGIAVAILRMNEKRAGKKKKRQQEAKRQTMVASLCAFWMVFLGGAAWLAMSNNLMHRLRSNSYYPYGEAKGPGFMSACAGAFLYLLMMLGAIYRWDPEFLPCWRPKPEPGEGEFEGGMPPPGMMMGPGGMPPPGMGMPPPGMYGGPPPPMMM